jgi:cell division septation protein DedD
VSRGPRVRGLVIAVAAVALALLGLSRWGGRMMSRGTSRRADGTPAHAGVGSGTPDLTFYRALGSSAPAGRRGQPPPSDPTLHQAPGDSVAPAGAYVVQVLATRDENQAKRLRDRLASKGYPASVVEDDASAPPVWRVRLGRWRDRGPAEAMAEKVRKQEGLEPWVLQEQGP